MRATQGSSFGPDFSYAVKKTKWPKVKATVRNGKVIAITTKKLRMTITKAPLRIEFATPDGAALNGDERARGMGWEGKRGRDSQ